MIFLGLSQREIADELLKDEFANWSYNGAMSLASYLLDVYDDCIKELDVVAIRCEYSEYKNIQECLESWGDDDLTEDDVKGYIVCAGSDYLIVYEA